MQGPIPCSRCNYRTFTLVRFYYYVRYAFINAVHELNVSSWTALHFRDARYNGKVFHAPRESVQRTALFRADFDRLPKTDQNRGQRSRYEWLWNLRTGKEEYEFALKIRVQFPNKISPSNGESRIILRFRSFSTHYETRFFRILLLTRICNG